MPLNGEHRVRKLHVAAPHDAERARGFVRPFPQFGKNQVAGRAHGPTVEARCVNQQTVEGLHALSRVTSPAGDPELRRDGGVEHPMLVRFPRPGDRRTGCADRPLVAFDTCGIATGERQLREGELRGGELKLGVRRRPRSYVGFEGARGLE